MGALVTFAGLPDPVPGKKINPGSSKSAWTLAAKDLRTDAECRVGWAGFHMVCGGEACVAPSLANAVVS